MLGEVYHRNSSISTFSSCMCVRLFTRWTFPRSRAITLYFNGIQLSIVLFKTIENISARGISHHWIGVEFVECVYYTLHAECTESFFYYNHYTRAPLGHCFQLICFAHLRRILLHAKITPNLTHLFFARFSLSFRLPLTTVSGAFVARVGGDAAVVALASRQHSQCYWILLEWISIIN